MPLDALILSRGPGLAEHSDWPLALITGTGNDPRPRLRVDNAQTSFYEGREFRLFHEFSINAGLSVWLKYTFDKNISVHGRTLTVLEGRLRLALCTGGTEGGSWTAKTIFPVNSMTDKPSYTMTGLAYSGGTLTGGAERDVMLLETGTSANAATVQAEIAEVGLAPGNYYIELRNTGSGVCRGMYAAHWEERMPKSPLLVGGSTYN